jgi:NAD(P) transhydrogenase
MANGESFDVIVIGAGPAGESAAVTAALNGKRVAVVEKQPYHGGAAVNTGTVPSKTLRETALALSGLRSRDLYGVDLSIRRGATIDDLIRHERAVRVGERERIADAFARHGVTVVHGTGAFADPHTVHVTRPDGSAVSLRGSHIVIAIGSVPVRPPGIPFEHDRIHDSDELLKIHELPKSIAVVGAGVIGSEYACMFAAIGVPTYLVDGRDKLLPFVDGEVSAALQAAMTRLGVNFIWKENVQSCPDPGSDHVKLTLSSGRILDVDHALICAGRMCRTPELKPELAGLTLAEKGRVPVNANFQTGVPHVYAVGDVIGFPALASTSAEQGREAAEHICDPGCDDACVAPVLPTGIYTIPELSAAGATEEELKKKNVDYVVGRASYADVPRGKIIGDRDGFLKLLFHRGTRKLLGVHVIGEQATEVVHIGVMAMMADGGIDLFRRTCFNYPTLGELYKHAALNAERRLGTGSQTED